MRRKTLLTVAVISSLVLIAGTVDLNNLLNYEDQNTPSYVIEDNTPQDNEISDEGATLGRILFYDKKLSKDNTIACASCHLQEYAFGDTALVSTGVNGVTARHSMRLVNARYSDEVRAFWDERAVSFEDQASQPIQDHVEMGYSGTSGDADFEDLIVELEATDIYPVLFEFVFEDSTITEERIQKSIAQFVRSMESFDSKYDIGRAQVNNDQMSFPNFTSEENLGKQLFFTGPPMGGAGCMRCHDGPEFTLITNTDNNGVIGAANDTSSIDLTNTHSPSLRDLVNPNGEMNGPFMHDGSLDDLEAVVDHYNDLEEVAANTNLDFRLAGAMHALDLNQTEKDALVAFLHTLTGSDIYTNEKWSDPFDEQGDIELIPLEGVGNQDLESAYAFKVFPNPATTRFKIELKEGFYQLEIFDSNGAKAKSRIIKSQHTEDVSELPSGIYTIRVLNLSTQRVSSQTLIKD